MKIIIPIVALMFLAGCGNNSTDQSNSTNSASGNLPGGSSDTHSPAVEMTNAPAITNGMGTNIPAMTNQ